MASDTTPVVVGVLYPPQFDGEQLVRAAAESGRPVEVSVGPYVENSAMRRAKREGISRDELRKMALPVSDEARAALARAEVVLALDIPVDLASLAPRLRWIQGFGAGVGQFDEKELAGRGIRLTTAAGVAAPPIAEFVMGRILEVWKDFRGMAEMQHQRVWRFTPGRLLAGATIGIVGFGAIGTAVAERARAFGMRVIATRRRFSPGTASPLADELSGPDGLDRLLSASDVVVLSAPETAETVNLIGEREIGLMPPGGVLCNVARGSLVDETALLAALASGHLAAAILDVTREEPLPADSPLWTAANVYLSPHSAASQDGYFGRLTELFGANLVRYVRGDPLVNLVEPGVGY